MNWYDLSTDRGRKHNLLAAGRPGLESYRVIDRSRLERLPSETGLVNVHTTFDRGEGNRIEFRSEYYLGDPDKEGGPDLAVTYQIHPDGLILVQIATVAGTGELAIGVTVDGRQGFDAVIGKVRNPALRSNTRIEYVLFRRVGAAAGADLLVAVKPWKEANLGIQCQLRPARDPRTLQAILTGEAKTGANTIHAMMRVWPADIDNLGNAEIYVRKFLETSSPELKPQTGSDSWQPTWSIK